MTTQQELRLQRAESLVASLAADLATERERLRVAREKWDALFLCISDDQGYVYDSNYAECVTCRSSAPTIAEIIHGEDCFTDLCGEMSRALAQLSAPVQAEQKEWTAMFDIGDLTSIPSSPFVSREVAEKRLAGLIECPGNRKNLRLVWRTKAITIPAGEWTDAEAKEQS